MKNNEDSIIKQHFTVMLFSMLHIQFYLWVYSVYEIPKLCSVTSRHITLFHVRYIRSVVQILKWTSGLTFESVVQILKCDHSNET